MALVKWRLIVVAALVVACASGDGPKQPSCKELTGNPNHRDKYTNSEQCSTGDIECHALTKSCFCPFEGKEAEQKCRENEDPDGVVVYEKWNFTAHVNPPLREFAEDKDAVAAVQDQIKKKYHEAQVTRTTKILETMKILGKTKRKEKRRNLGESEKGKQRVAKSSVTDTVKGVLNGADDSMYSPPAGADDSTGKDSTGKDSTGNDWSIPNGMKFADAGKDSKFKQQVENKVEQTMAELFGSDNQAVKDLKVEYEGYATPSGICSGNRLVGMTSCNGKEALGNFGIKEGSLCTDEEGDCKNIGVLSVTANSGNKRKQTKGAPKGASLGSGKRDNESDCVIFEKALAVIKVAEASTPGSANQAARGWVARRSVRSTRGLAGCSESQVMKIDAALRMAVADVRFELAKEQLAKDSGK